MPIVKSVRVGQHPEYTRFVMEVSDKVDYQVSMLADPYRVVVDFPEMGWQLPNGHNPRMYGSLSGFRYGLFKTGTSRIVLDAKGPVKIKKTMVLPPRGKVRSWRFVMDLVNTNRATFLALLKPATFPGKPVAKAVSRVQPKPIQPARVPAMLPPAKPKKKSKHVVVIDAGHGGVDPGARGVSGAYEKHITLAIARQLRDALKRTGRYKVVLTRDRDVFIPLRERTAIARRAGADLFISLHADTFRDKSVRGASVYTLSERASSKEAQALAERENKADLIAGVDLSTKDDDLSFILLDMAQRDTTNQSSRFAETLVKDISRSGKVLRNPHRFAGFAVLKAPDVPAVLIELGFLSNKYDERSLRSKKFRAKMADAIKTSINRYFNRVEEANRL
ncbi:N-acetylmuramoyl-L-alanine amidase [Terasakiella sp. SH-1]|uniref:N-acetylmuramoyl-L-alanine amidase n=1 Tax=Terasakiella sp. SH-1 TaxID=2560057 RepID=UPI0014314EA5|nr:N-acetylmuramoyl-L-alanine amidase [Terasakiella sp. SH-1]